MEKKSLKKTKLHPGEIMTIVIEFHRSNYRTFKHFYKNHVLKNLTWAFHHLVSYNRFVELKQSILIPLSFYLQSRKGNSTGIAFIDSPSIAVCNNKRIHSNRVFKEIAERGKNSKCRDRSSQKQVSESSATNRGDRKITRSPYRG